MFVRNWMSSPVVVLPTITPVVDALEYMDVKDIRRVPVLHDGVLAGIVVRSDLEAAVGRTPGLERRSRITLGDIMTKTVVTVAPDDTLEHASQIMLANQVSGLPVVDGPRLAGMITESDIFEAFNEIMGTSENGARIAMTIPADKQLLDSLRRRLKGLSIQSLATYRNQETGAWEVVVKVCGRRPVEVA